MILYIHNEYIYFTYLQRLRHGHNLQYMYFKYSYDIPLYDGNPDESLGGGLGGQWDTTLDASPHLDGSFMNWSFVIFFLSPLLGVCFVLAIFMSTNLTNSNKNHEHREMMLCNDFPHWQGGYCALLRMIPSCQWGKSLHSIISQCLWFLFEFVSLYS